MENDEWALKGENADLEREAPTDPEILTIILPTESVIENSIEQTKTKYFGNLLNRPLKFEVKVQQTEIEYSPYLILSGRYIARYVRANNYVWKVSSDVVSVRIKDDVLDVDKKALRISNLFAEGFSAFTVGGVVRFSNEHLEGVVQKGISRVIGKRDISLASSKNIPLRVTEQAIYDTGEKNLCYDASSASIVEASDILKAIKRGVKTIEGRPANYKENLDFRKAINDAEKKLVKLPDGRILEHVFKVSLLSLVFMPKIRVILEYKSQQKEITLDATSFLS
jgi:hypothetical protein